ncbi:MAG: LytR C-terminal domain-containing protein [Actinobacteria bacterium]|nr:LytR C-terminal domain-containing protein [Actinomycetota bacterium]
MEKRWPILVGIAFVGTVAGVAVAGQDDHISSMVIAPATETTTVDVPGESTLPPVTITSTTILSTTSAAPASTAPQTSAAPTTEAPTTTEPPQPTVDPGTTTLARGEVRIVVANGDGRFNLAGANANQLLRLGYVDIDQEDASKVDATTIYYRPGFDDEAAIVASDILVPDAVLLPLPDTGVTNNDQAGDVIIILGPDAKREEFG